MATSQIKFMLLKLDQEPHYDSLVDVAGVEPHDDPPDEVDGVQVGQEPYVCLLNEENYPFLTISSGCFTL